MKNYDAEVVMDRIIRIANKVYRNNNNAVYMLINDLEEFFEMNDYDKSVERMTTEEFDQYLKNICNTNERV